MRKQRTRTSTSTHLRCHGPLRKQCSQKNACVRPPPRPNVAGRLSRKRNRLPRGASRALHAKGAAGRGRLLADGCQVALAGLEVVCSILNLASIAGVKAASDMLIRLRTARLPATRFRTSSVLSWPHQVRRLCSYIHIHIHIHMHMHIHIHVHIHVHVNVHVYTYTYTYTYFLPFYLFTLFTLFTFLYPFVPFCTLLYPFVPFCTLFTLFTPVSPFFHPFFTHFSPFFHPFFTLFSPFFHPFFTLL